MTVKTVFTGRATAVLLAVWSFFFLAAAKGGDVSLTWDPIANPSVAGFTLYWGLASGNYNSSIDAGLDNTVTVSGLAPGVTYYFAAQAYDASGDQGPLSSEFVYTIPGVPVIVSPPASQTAVAGTTATFSVGAASLLPLTYQWFYGANPIAGATNGTLALSSVSDAAAGYYTVVVSSDAGSATSSPALLSLVDPPVIVSSPLVETVAAGANVVFPITVTGTPPFTFQWYQGGTRIATGTKPTLHLVNVSTANSDNYSVTVQNAAGTAAGIVATLTVTAGSTTPFAQVAGTYNGLFYPTNTGNSWNITPQTAGFFGNCVVGASGVYSALISLGGFSFPLAGTFNATGYDSEILSRASTGQSNLMVTLNLDMTGASQSMTGVVSNTDTGNPWTAPLLADLAGNAPSVPATSFLMSLQPTAASSTNSPQNSTFLYVLNVPSGNITLFGTLSDGTPISQNVPTSQNGTIPVYLSLYGGQGVLEGWVNLSNDQPTGTLTWVRQLGVLTPVPYWAGFTNVLSAH